MHRISISTDFYIYILGISISYKEKWVFFLWYIYIKGSKMTLYFHGSILTIFTLQHFSQVTANQWLSITAENTVAPISPVHTLQPVNSNSSWNRRTRTFTCRWIDILYQFAVFQRLQKSHHQYFSHFMWREKQQIIDV